MCSDLRTWAAVKTVAIFLAAVASSTRAEPLLPTATGTTWKYQMVQEFGKGVHPSADENAKVDPDGKVRLPVSVVAAGSEKIDSVDTTKYQLIRQGTVQLTEFFAVDDKGVTAIARIPVGEGTYRLLPSQTLLKFPLREGDKWEYVGKVRKDDGDQLATKQEFEIVAREAIQMPAGKFDSYHLRMTVLSPEPKIVEDRWFAPNIGFVKIVTEIDRPDGELIQRVSLELAEQPKIASVAPAPAIGASETAKKLQSRASVAASRQGEPTTSFDSATDKIYCRWESDSLNTGAVLRAVWIAEDVGEVAPKNYKIAEKSLTLSSGQDNGVFTISRPTNGWPVGKYRVEIYDGDQLVETLKFDISK